MFVVKADLNLCQGYGNCVVEAPSIFDIGDQGTVIIMRQTVDEADRETAEAAARSCPVSALSVERLRHP